MANFIRKKWQHNMDFDTAILKFIVESGNAVSGVSPIKKENVAFTIEKVEELILEPIGALKKIS